MNNEFIRKLHSLEINKFYDQSITSSKSPLAPNQNKSLEKSLKETNLNNSIARICMFFCVFFVDLLITSWGTRRCTGLKKKEKKLGYVC